MKLLIAPLVIALSLSLLAEDKEPPAKPDSGRLTKLKILEQEKANHQEKGGEGKKPESGPGEFLKRADCNHDGILSDDECQTFAEQIAKTFERNRNGIGKEMDANQDGKLSGDELAALKSKLKCRFAEASRQRDVTCTLNDAIKNGAISFTVNNAALGGDPAPNTVKCLRVKYQYNGTQLTTTVKEDATLSLKGAADLKIIEAYYGPAEKE